jgi:hypothetical protein
VLVHVDGGDVLVREAHALVEVREEVALLGDDIDGLAEEVSPVGLGVAVGVGGHLEGADEGSVRADDADDGVEDRAV